MGPVTSRTSADPASFDSAKQFDDLLDAYVGGLEARIGERTCTQMPGIH
jgi:hypothetical protein